MQESDIILYRTPDGAVKVEIRFEDETFWLTQKKLAELFGVEVQTINYHLKEIFKSGELQEEATIRKIRIVQTEGNREVSRMVDFYSLDAIIAVGYRVNSYQATQFRIWATKVLREYLIKGFVMDDERLKQGKRFDKDYFDELLERIRKTVRSIASPLKKCPHKLDIMTFCTYICNNSTRHASRQISVPGRVF